MSLNSIPKKSNRLKKAALAGLAAAEILTGSAQAHELSKKTTPLTSVEAIIDDDTKRTEAIDCLTRNVYHEARGESVEGQLAVALVTLGRMLDPQFKHTVCGVVYQKNQFSWTLDSKLFEKPLDEKRYNQIRSMIVEKIQDRRLDEALTLLSMSLGLPHNTLFYKRHDFVGSPRVEKMFKELTLVARTGNHNFYTLPKKKN